jgi:Transposase DDE domain
VTVAQVMGDGAYGSGQNLAGCANYPGHPVDLVVPLERPADPAVHKSAFAIDLVAKTATCPQGHTVTGTAATVYGVPGLEFGFARATCEACPLFARCVKAKLKGRTVRADAYESYRQAARLRQDSAEFKVLYPLRSRVERKQAELVWHGLRETRYLGQAKRQLQRLWTAAAVNLKRLFKLAEQRPRALRAALSQVQRSRMGLLPA